MTRRDPTTELPMYEDLPADEMTAPSLVSTGELPTAEQVRDVVTEAYERFRGNDDGAVADYIPALASASPELFGISVVGAKGRFFEHASQPPPLRLAPPSASAISAAVIIAAAIVQERI